MRIPIIFSPICQAILLLSALMALLVFPATTFASAEGIHFIQIFGWGGIIFFALRFLTGIKKAPESLFVTLALMFLLLSPLTTDWTFGFHSIVLFCMVAVAVASKYFLEILGRPIINPAVLAVLFGLFVARLIPSVTIVANAERLTFDQLFSVGGISISWVALLLAIWIFWGLPKWDRTHVLTAFFVACALFAFLLGGASRVAEFFSTNPFFYLFAAFLLTDPKTSPDQHRGQWLFGFLVAVLVFIPQIAPLGDIPFIQDYALLLALALANIGLVVFDAIRLG